MTLPPELVKAAHDAMRERWYDTTSEEKALLAVAAVLRALPKSEALIEASIAANAGHHCGCDPIEIAKRRTSKRYMCQYHLGMGDGIDAVIAKLADDV